ncbi:hypothetical protein D3C86_1340140 [compost metagenome]
MGLDQGVHAEALGLGQQVGGQGVVDHGQDDEDAVGAQGAALGHLPGIDQEVLAQAGQGDRVARGGQEGVVALEAGAVGQDGQAGRAAALIGFGQRGRVEVGADQALGRAGLLDLGDQGGAAGVLGYAFQSGAEAARGRGQGGEGLDGVLRGSKLAGGHVVALVGGDLRQNVGHAASGSMGVLVTRTRVSSAAAARPSSMTAAASSAPSRRSAARSATTRAAAALSTTMSR